MHQFFVVLAFFGFTYGAFAVIAIGWQSLAMSQDIERESAEVEAIASEPGVRGTFHRIVAPLYWFVTLPLKAPSAAIFIALVMAVPALVV